MANKKGRRRFGTVRQRDSGRWQARYRGPDGLMRPAPRTFDSKRSAEQWLTLKEGEILRGEWQAPEQGKVQLSEYAYAWVRERKLSPRPRELYGSLLRLHIVPLLGARTLDTITTQAIRSWRTDLLESGRSESVAAKAYRLLRAILNTAVREDRIIRENPCRFPGYDKEPTSDRPVATVDQVWKLSDLMPGRYRALVLFAAFTGLRWGELTALRVRDLDLDEQAVRVARKFAELDTGQRVPGETKSLAGTRVVTLPPPLVDAMRVHVRVYVGSAPESLLFVGPRGASLRRTNFHRSVKWSTKVRAAGLPTGFHFHDLRHTGNNLAAAAGASTRELMHRMGHASMRAALIYQHATSARDREIADAMGARIARTPAKKGKKKAGKKKGRKGG